MEIHSTRVVKLNFTTDPSQNGEPRYHPSLASLSSPLRSPANSAPDSSGVVSSRMVDEEAGGQKRRLSVSGESPDDTQCLAEEAETGLSLKSPETNSLEEEEDAPPVRPPLAKQLHDIANLVDQEAETNTSPYVFLIDACWLRSWIESSVSQLAEPGPINNAQFLSPEARNGNPNVSFASQDREDTKIRRFLLLGLLPGRDFFAVSPEIWEALYSWYEGGPALPRRRRNIHFTPEETSGRSTAESSFPAGPFISDLLHAQDKNRVAEALDSFFVSYSSGIELYPEVPPTVSDVQFGASPRTSGRGLVRVRSSNFNDVGASAMSQVGSGSGGADSASAAPVTDDNGSDSTDTTKNEIGEGTSSKLAKPSPSGGITDANSCFVCRRFAQSRCANCSATYYCSGSCQKSHWKYHRLWCPLAAKYKDLPRGDFERFVAVGRRGRVGLFNLGNSCYLSSCLQCLSHITPLTAHFLSSRYLEQINGESKDGTGGRLANEYATLMKELWFENRAAVSPMNLKKVLGRIRDEYAGFQQHDAHELLELLLDKLHEDINLVKCKPYTERCEGDGSNDNDLAKQAWERHGLRENSEVRNILGGQSRSQLVCPDCGKKAVCFEYQQTIPIPIPRKAERTLSVIFVPVLSNLSKEFEAICQPSDASNNSRELLQRYELKLLALRPLRMTANCDRICLAHTVKKTVAKLIQEESMGEVPLYKPVSRLVLLELGGTDNSSVVQILHDNDSLSRLKEGSSLVAYSSTDSLPGHLFVLHRQLILPDEDSDAKLDWNLTGTPMLVNFNMGWSCMRVRVLVWQQIIRFLVASDTSSGTEPASPLLRAVREAILRAELTKDVKSMFAHAQSFPLRMVDATGRGQISQLARSKGWISKTIHPNDSFDVDGFEALPSGADMYLGSQIPADNSIAIGDFFGMHQTGDEVRFVAVDWHDTWQQLLDQSNEICVLRNHRTYAEQGSSQSEGGAGDNKISLYKCLEEHTREELLDEANAWYCSQCKKHQCARKIVKFWASHMPEVLVLALKRFEFRDLTSLGRAGMAHREKIESFVDFPIEGLDMAPFCEGYPHFSNLDPSIQNEVCRNGITYDLFAVCNHYGRMGFGHYTAVARNWEGSGLSPTWCAFDDDEVAVNAVKNEIVSKAAYILFYRRRSS